MFDSMKCPECGKRQLTPRLARRHMREKHLRGTHPGIELRISNMNGELVRADSQHLHYSAKYSGATKCTPNCPSACNRHGWYELIPGEIAPGAMPYQYDPDLPKPSRLKIEIKAVRIPNPH